MDMCFYPHILKIYTNINAKFINEFSFKDAFFSYKLYLIYNIFYNF